MDQYKNSRRTRRSRRRSPTHISHYFDTPSDERAAEHNPFSRKPTRMPAPKKPSRLSEDSDSEDELQGITIERRYKLCDFLGRGSFGNVYRGLDLKTQQPIAAKAESVYARCPQLVYEYRVYTALRGGIGIPNAHWLGNYEDKTILIMELLGPNLQRLRTDHTFSLCTVLILADQMLRRLEYIHEQGFVYRDVKPNNFVMGTGGSSRRVYILDFGLVKRYITERGHIPFDNEKHLTGTARYSSLHSHKGYELSRRDDLEALGYVLVYLIVGELPWQGTQGNTKQEKYERIGRKKAQLSLSKLCEACPPEFVYYLRYCRNLPFEQEPDYAYLRRLFRNVMIRMRYSYNTPYDWETDKTSIAEN